MGIRSNGALWLSDKALSMLPEGLKANLDQIWYVNKEHKNVWNFEGFKWYPNLEDVKKWNDFFKHLKDNKLENEFDFVRVCSEDMSSELSTGKKFTLEFITSGFEGLKESAYWFSDESLSKLPKWVTDDLHNTRKFIPDSKNQNVFHTQQDFDKVNELNEFLEENFDSDDFDFISINSQEDFKIISEEEEKENKRRLFSEFQEANVENGEQEAVWNKIQNFKEVLEKSNSLKNPAFKNYTEEEKQNAVRLLESYIVTFSNFRVDFKYKVN
jgi:hypothetical protein